MNLLSRGRNIGFKPRALSSLCILSYAVFRIFPDLDFKYSALTVLEI